MIDSSAHPNVTVESVSPATHARRTVTIEFLFLDRERCERCRGTGDALEEALSRVAGLLDDLGVDVEVRTIHVRTARDARRVRLETSPTIRIDGRDLQPTFAESQCDPCGDLGACDAVDCRLWRYRGEDHETPPVPLLVEAILRHSTAPERAAEQPRDGEYRLPGNLASFFGDASGPEDGCCE